MTGRRNLRARREPLREVTVAEAEYKGIYAGSLTIGGLIERGDTYQLVTSQPERFGNVGALDPDEIADTAWQLFTKRNSPEATVNALTR